MEALVPHSSVSPSIFTKSEPELVAITCLAREALYKLTKTQSFEIDFQPGMREYAFYNERIGLVPFSLREPFQDSHIYLHILKEQSAFSITDGKPIGEGGFSRVYRGYFVASSNQGGEEKVVFHRVVLKRSEACRSDESLEDKQMEFQILQNAKDCPFVVHAFAAFTFARQFFLFEEFCTTDLFHWVNSYRGRLPIKQAVEMISSIAKGCLHLNRMQVIHTDLKPENILVNLIRGKVVGVKVCDLEDHAAPGRDRSPRGTVAYLSPEVITEKFEYLRSELERGLREELRQKLMQPIDREGSNLARYSWAQRSMKQLQLPVVISDRVHVWGVACIAHIVFQLCQGRSSDGIGMSYFSAEMEKIHDAVAAGVGEENSERAEAYVRKAYEQLMTLKEKSQVLTEIDLEFFSPGAQDLLRSAFVYDTKERISLPQLVGKLESYDTTSDEQPNDISSETEKRE